MKSPDFSNLKARDGKPRVMAHIVAGYPDFETNEKLICEFANAGVALIEIQIPFSDPLADGATIMRANQISLQRHRTSVDDCLDLMSRVAPRVDAPLLFMSYANSVYAYGFEKFAAAAAHSGCRGFIVPDLPFDAPEARSFNAACQTNGLPNILVISANADAARLKSIAALAQGFIYLTLRVGVTGTRRELDESALNYISQLRAVSDLPIAAGFGVSKAEHIQRLAGKLDIAVVGSRLIEIQEQSGADAVVKFVQSLTQN